MLGDSLGGDLKLLEEAADLSWKKSQIHPESQPEAATFDLLRYPSWKLLTHAGFLTLFHYDADGLSTWTSVVNGAKLWCYLKPKPGHEEDEDPNHAGPHTHHLYVLLLTPGTIL